MSSLAHCEFEIDIKKQRQRGCDDVRLTESRIARGEQILMMPPESLTD